MLIGLKFRKKQECKAQPLYPVQARKKTHVGRQTEQVSSLLPIPHLPVCEDFIPSDVSSLQPTVMKYRFNSNLKQSR